MPLVAEAIARQFHETYERLALDYGYETRKASAVPWDEVPDKKRRLMIAVCQDLIDTGWIDALIALEAAQRAGL